MLQSLALILICGLTLGGIMQKLKLPGLLGMIIAGMILGPYLLNLISPSVLDISIDLQEIALIVILMRAGLALDLKSLRKVGRPAILMSFIPATIEFLAITILAPIFLNISLIESAILGAVLASVSPAVLVPRMLKFMENGYDKKAIPQMLMTSASVNGIYVIVLFTAFLGMYSGNGFNAISFVNIPISIVTGVILGAIVGFALILVFKKIHMRDTVKALILFAAGFGFVTLESVIGSYVPMSGLIAVVALGMIILRKYEILAKRLSVKFSKIWVGAEIFLFVLIGAAVDVRHIQNVGLPAVAVILSAVVIRMLSVFLCLFKTELNIKEKLFCTIAYLPKATIQAAIGGIPLAMGVEAGNIILSVSVLAILITAPLGALGMDLTYKSLQCELTPNVVQKSR